MTKRLKTWAVAIAVVYAFAQMGLSAAGVTLISFGSALPTNCSAGNVFVKTSATIGLYYASATGSPCTTWTQAGGGSGSVTNTGTLTANQVIIGNGSADIKALGSAGTTTTVLHGNAAGAPSFGSVSLVNDITGVLGSSNGGAGSVNGIMQANGSGTVSAITVGSGLSFASGTLSSSGGGGGGGGALVLLASQTASSSASLAFTTRNATGQSGALFQSDFDNYYVVTNHLVPATNDVVLQMTVSTNGGSTWESTNYLESYHYISASATHGAGNMGGFTSYFYIADHLSNTASNGGTSGSYTFLNPRSTTSHKMYFGSGNMLSVFDSQFYTISPGGRWASTTAIDSIKFAMSSGNIASGSVYVYGFCKTGCASSGLGQSPVVCTSTAVATGTGRIPNDDTIPQNTEGDEYLTCAITPTNASSKLIVQATLAASCSVGASSNLALFQDSTANALAAAVGMTSTAADWYMPITLAPYSMTAGTTSSTTFKLRASCNTGTMTVNGFGGGRAFGAIPKSSMVVYEYLP